MKSYLLGLLILLGTASFVWGVWLVYRPAAFMVAGFIAAAAGFLAVYDSMRSSGRKQ